MNRYVAILRGINVGGRRKILMAELKEMFSKLKCKNIETYIQSGNVGFNLTTNMDEKKLAEKFEKNILKTFAHEVPVIVRKSDSITKVAKKNPFLHTDDQKRLHLTFLAEAPSKEALDKMATYDYSPDKFLIASKNVYVYCSGDYSKSKLTNKFFESKLKVKATTRNWKTVLKLSEL